MKTILFDLYEAQPVATSKFHGGGEYIKKVFKNLAENYNNKCEIIVFYDNNRFLDEWVIDIIRKNKMKEYYISSKEDIRYIFEKEEIDTFYSGLPYYYKREWIPDDVCFVGTIHGLRFLELPSDKFVTMYTQGKNTIKEKIRYYVQNLYRKKKQCEFSSCIKMLDEIICVSNHTRFSLLKWFPEEKSKKINVFYSPLKEAEFSQDIESEIEDKYILIMGGDRWIKNCYRTILAIEELFKNGFLEEYKVVIVGGLNKKIKKHIRNLNKYVIKDYIESAELESLYKYTDLFVYASLNEGFGIPPLEAMKYGVTCVVSGVCSLPEVYEDAVYYVNPYDIDEIAVRILTAINQKKDRNIVMKRVKDISTKQVEDLYKLCNLIVGEE